MFQTLLLLASLMCFLATGIVYGQAAIVLDQESGTIEITGLAAENLAELKSADLSLQQWRALFPVYVGAKMPKASEEKLPMLGKYQVEAELIRFTPRFSLLGGLSYYARFDLRLFAKILNLPNKKIVNKEILEAAFNIPNEGEATTFVEQIYPSANEIPENQLKLYIHFSAPMQRGNVYQYIRLRDDEGNEVAQPFIEVTQEAWDRQNKRLTLFFNPGRIKRGLRPHQDMGLNLQAGKAYQLEISAEMKDAKGHPLIRHFRKSFSVSAADRRMPNPEEWQIISPVVGSESPLILTFSEPLDHALLMRFILVFDAMGNQLDGAVRIRKTEKEWAFFPANLWQSGKYAIQVNRLLEDLAGNNLNRLFDLEMNHHPLKLENFENTTILYFDIPQKN